MTDDGRRVSALLLLVVLLTGCLRPGEERAELDLDVGRVSVGGMSLTVANGLAAVRHAEAGSVSLWAQAPDFTATMAFDDAASSAMEWVIEVDNAMPAAELVVVGGAAVVTEQYTRRAVLKRWAVTPQTPEVTVRIAPADADVADGFRFAVFGDVQEDIYRVQDIYRLMGADPQLRFVLMTGDLTSSGTRDELVRFQEQLRGLAVPMFATRGNHELGDDPIYFTRLFGRANFHFVFKGLEVSMVDSGNAGLDPLVYDWLEDWIAGVGDGDHIFLTHLPPLEPVGTRSGSFRSRKEAGKLISILGRGGLDGLFFGHVHSLYSYSLAGVPAWISGGGGAIPERMDGVERHFLRVTVVEGGKVDGVTLVRVD